jgi:hypothetical protein
MSAAFLSRRVHYELGPAFLARSISSRRGAKLESRERIGCGQYASESPVPLLNSYDEDHSPLWLAV